MAFTDKQITCVQCGNTFVFTAGEQEFYQEKGYTNEPKRCRACREEAKRAKSGGATLDRGGSYAAGPGNGGMTRGGRQMYDIICDNCQQPSQVPFQPTPGRKILCRPCFQASR
ncbi:MAG TPA: zinc-ribbon domain containing protein [Thermodesulfobacteriota bacterium]